MSDDNKSLARRFYEEVFNKGNLAVIDELCDPAFKDHTPMPGVGDDLATTKQTFAMFLEAFSELKLNIDGLVAEGDTVAVRFTMTGKHTGPLFGAPATGKPVTMHGIDWIRVKDGRATDVWHYGDDAMVMIELGVQPPA